MLSFISIQRKTAKGCYFAKKRQSNFFSTHIEGTWISVRIIEVALKRIFVSFRPSELSVREFSVS